ncbi:serine protease snake-like [Anopheles marshallii]|uniref:serine protease snake-like n=1 Tax=Anopheles marshallii TaxID=1521116 RepID=UPI00237A71A0|nr:serine protease snake-like [Anopheles marshallii]
MAASQAGLTMWSVFLVLCCLTHSLLALQEGESCQHQGETGVCRPYSKCKRGNRITVCSYSATEAIICCPPSQQLEPAGVSRTGPLSSTNRAGTVERISEKKCRDYKDLTTESVAISALTLNPTLVKIDVPKCDMVVKLIVGGNITKPGEFPHMAAIGWRRPNGGYSFECGGSLISEYYLLTAAHCYAESESGELPSMVRLGDQNLVRDDDGAEPEDYDIKQFIVHPDFKWSAGKYNDLALIETNERVVFTNFIRPACLYTADRLDVSTAIATGFGLTEDFGPKSDELRKVALNIYDNALCADRYRLNRHIRQGISSTQMCVGDLSGGKDTCQGDSGGPLQVTREENQCMFYIVGVTSFGQVCGSATPAIYSRVSSYLDWIESVVWQ